MFFFHDLQLLLWYCDGVFFLTQHFEKQYLFCDHLNVKHKILDPNAAQSFFNIITYIQRGYRFKQNVKLLTCFDVDFTQKRWREKSLSWCKVAAVPQHHPIAKPAPGQQQGGCKSDLTYEMWLPWELKVAFGFCHGPVVWATPWDWRNEARSVRSPSMTQSQLAGTWNEQLSWRLHCTAQHGKDQQLDVVQGRFNKR